MLVGYLSETEIGENGEEFDFYWSDSDAFFVGLSIDEVELARKRVPGGLEAFFSLVKRQYLTAFRMAK